MQAYSGILLIDRDHERNGSATIDFARFHPHGQDVGDAQIRQPINVGGQKRFNGPPAYTVNFREWVQDDKARGGGESDDFILNSNVNEDRLQIDWRLGDDHGGIKEISFIVIGE
jgi:hypothetical protein